ncbi:tetratricopeptide repeat protein [Thermodesulfobacteriota bacterium]
MTPLALLRGLRRILFTGLIIFTPLAFGSVQPWARTVLHIGSLAVLALWLLEKGFEGNLRIRSTPLHLFWVLALLYGTARMALSVYTEASLREVTLVLDLAILFVVAVELIDDRKALHRTLLLLGLLGVGVSVYRYLNLETGLALTHINKNHFAGYVGAVAFLCLGHFASTWPLASRPSLWRGYVFSIRAVTGICGALLIFALLRSQSVGATIAFFVTLPALGFLLFFSGREVPWRRLLLISLAFLVASAILAFVLYEPLREEHAEFFRLKTGTAKVRLSIWMSTLRMTLDHLVTGVGPGMYVHRIAEYREPNINLYIKFFYAHNEYLHLLAEYGLIGVGIFLYGILGAGVWSLRKLWSRRNPLYRRIAIGPMTACLFIGIHNLLDFNFHIPANAVLFVICMAMLYRGLAMHDGLGEGSSDLVLSRWSAGKGVTWIVVSVIIFLLAVDGSASLNSLRSCRAFSDGERAMSEGDYPRAIRAFRRAASYNRLDADHYYRLANVLHGQGEAGGAGIERDEALQAAEWAYREALRLNPYHYNACADLGRVLVLAGRFEEAETFFVKAVDLNPVHPKLHRLLAFFYLNFRADGLGPGLQAYRKVIALDPRNAMAYFQTIHSCTNSYEDLSEAIPDTPALHTRFATYLEGNGMWQAAADELKKALSSDPANADYTIRLAGLLDQNGDHEGAAGAWSDLRRVDPKNNRAIIGEGEQILKMGRVAEAREIFKHLVRLHSGHFDGYRFLAETYLVEGDLRGARKVWEDAVERIPWRGDFYFELAKIRKEDGEDWLQTVRDAKRAVELEPDRIVCRVLLEELYLEKEMRYDAISIWKEYLHSNTSDIEARRRLARLYEAQGRIGEAIAEYERILKQNRRDTEAESKITALKMKLQQGR